MEEKSFLRALSVLPTLSPVFRYICKIVENPRSSVTDVVKVLQLDPVIAARVLRLANSACAGFEGRISTLQNAVAILGVPRLHSLLLVTHLSKSRNDLKLPFSLVRFWRHSVFCALVAESIARHMRRYEMVDEHEVFAAALLHDLGKLVLGIISPDELSQIVDRAISESQPFFVMEDSIDSHIKIGELCATQWNLPLDLGVCIGGHHSPQNYPQQKYLVSIVHIADIMTHTLGYAIFENETAPGIDPAALALIRFPIEYLKVIAEAVFKDQRDLELLVEIIQ